MYPRRDLIRFVALTLGIIISSGGVGRATLGLDPLLELPASLLTGSSPVIVTAVDTATIDQLALIVQQAGGTPGRRLGIINGLAAVLPNPSILAVAASSLVQHVAYDRMSGGAMERTGPTIGAPLVRAELGVDGSGIGVAVIDSGITAWHDDLANGSGGQRVSQFVDLVSGAPLPYDDYGHGTHVAGIIAGNGFDSGGARSGIAPGANLVIIKALDGSGQGRISDVIAGLDYVVSHQQDFNIRIVNLSVGAGVYESYYSDPLTLAAKRAVDRGIVVVAAAGNAGRTPSGATQYGAITAPGNAPWVLTVGASSTMGTIDRSDDTVAAFSSRGPTVADRAAKPDLVAPGVGTESLSAPNSALYNSLGPYLLSGTVATPYLPYLSLSGTSMAAPVVAGTVALMLQANPALTPNGVKAILQFTAQLYSGVDALTEGAGFLNARGAVELAKYWAAPPWSMPYPSTIGWSQRIVWGNYSVGGGTLTANASAWSVGVTWGTAPSPGMSSIGWGQICTAYCNSNFQVSSTWAATCADPTCGSVQWGQGSSTNVVWGNSCGGNDCSASGSGQASGSTVVWGSGDNDTVVWGSGYDDTVVWGSSDGDTVVWGSNCADSSCQPVVWTSQ
jgi:serine protease AprX